MLVFACPIKLPAYAIFQCDLEIYTGGEVTNGKVNMAIKGNNKITELRTILQRESQNS
jgi:hypothetical protein